MCCVLLSRFTYHSHDYVSLIFVHNVCMSLFSQSLCLSFLTIRLLLYSILVFWLSVMIFKRMHSPFWTWIKCFPCSLCYFKFLCIHSVCLCLLDTRGHVCMTKEMQSLAQTITVCLVCTIYMKYIFICDMRGHKIASHSFLFLSYAITWPLCLLRFGLFRNSF